MGDVRVVTSINNFTDTCTLKVPRKVKHDGKDITHYIRRNDAVQVDLGYGDELDTVFKGYIKSVSTGMPIVIECENRAWKLKQTKIEATHYPTLTLNQFLGEHLAGYNVKSADINLGEYRIAEGVNLAQMFDKFSKELPLYFYFRDDVFYAGLRSALTVDDQRVIKFEKGINFQKDDLVYTKAEDYNLQIIAKTILKDNTKIEHKEPATVEGAEVRTFYVPEATTVEDLKTFAVEKLNTYKIDKMSGTISPLGKPYVRKGDIVHLFDSRSPERNDKKFLAEGVTYTFGQTGYKQTITLGMQIQ